MVQDNPNLISKKAMTAMSSTAGSGRPLVHEIFTKVNNAKDKPKKIAVLRQYDSPALRMLVKGAFDPKIEWELPPGEPPFIPNEAPEGTEHTLLENEAKRLWHFVKGADPKLNSLKKETLFIQILEGLHADEAQVLLDIKNKKLNKTYKGFSDSVAKEAFGWNDDFVTP